MSIYVCVKTAKLTHRVYVLLYKHFASHMFNVWIFVRSRIQNFTKKISNFSCNFVLVSIRHEKRRSKFNVLKCEHISWISKEKIYFPKKKKKKNL